MATIRSNLTDAASACAVLACQVLTPNEMATLYAFLGEQMAGSNLKRFADAAQLAEAAETLVGIAAVQTALNTAGWEVAD